MPQSCPQRENPSEEVDQNKRLHRPSEPGQARPGKTPRKETSSALQHRVVANFR